MGENRATSSEFAHSLNRLNIRCEYLGILVFGIVLTVVHRTEIDWGVYIGLFLYIDVIGYIPGLIRSLQLRTGRIRRGYFIAYNVTHSFLTALPLALVVSAWTGATWSALAVVVHLAGDRGLFDNWMKSPSGEFEHVKASDRAERANAGGRDAH